MENHKKKPTKTRLEDELKTLECYLNQKKGYYELAGIKSAFDRYFITHELDIEIKHYQDINIKCHR